MVPYARLVQDYLAALVEGSDEVRFLEAVPWIVGTHRQDPAHIFKGLRAEASRFIELPDEPSFSLITPLWNTPPRLLRELILSVLCQSWLRWELILVDDGSKQRDHLDVARAWSERDPRVRLFTLDKNLGISGARNHAIERSTGDFVVILDHDDLLHPLALGTYVRFLHDAPHANFLFSNEARINEESNEVGFGLYKPPFDLATLLRVNYLRHFTAIRRDLLLAAERDGQIFRPQFAGAEDHDLYLRIAMSGRVRPIHVPMCLYYSRMIATSTAMSGESMPDTDALRRRMLGELLPEVYPGARWTVRPPSPELGNMYPSIHLTALTSHPRPKLLVMVPFRDEVDVTLRCLASLEGQQHDLDVHILLINNQSQDPATSFGLAEWLDQPRRHRYEVVDHPGAFNYARMHNMAVDRHGRGRDLLLFLNNDVELVSPDCLQTLAMHLLADPKCAFAGIRLEYPAGGGIQHGGIKIHETNLTCGCPAFLHASEVTDHVREERVVFGVTFACAMVRREVFEHLGGLDEVMIPNAYGDVDIEARALSLGYANFYYGTLTGLHHESKTRGRASEEHEFLTLHARHAQVINDWKLRGFTLSLQNWPATVAPAPVREPGPEAAPEPNPRGEPAAVPIPLRYKVADRLNHALKLALGPAHSVLKLALIRSRQWLRTSRARGTETVAVRRGPHFPMDHDEPVEDSCAESSPRV